MFTLKPLTLFILFQVGYMKEYCQLDKAKKDVFFLLDSSGSVGFRNFQTAKAFIAGFIHSLPIGESDTHVAIVRFSTAPKRYASLNSYYSNKLLRSAVASIRYTGGSTNTAEALEFSRTKLMRQHRGDRQDVENIIIVITDGSSTSSPSKLRREISILHSRGVVVAAVGVGSLANKTELDFMASEDRLSFKVKDYKALFEIQSSLFGVTCEASNNKPDLETTNSTTPGTTDSFGVASSTKNQTVLAGQTKQHSSDIATSTQAHASPNVHSHTLESFATRGSYVTKSHEQTSDLSSSKPNTVETFGQNIDISKSKETDMRLFTTVEFRKYIQENSSTQSLLSISNQNHKRKSIFSNSESTFKRQTMISQTSTNRYKFDELSMKSGQFVNTISSKFNVYTSSTPDTKTGQFDRTISTKSKGHTMLSTLTENDMDELLKSRRQNNFTPENRLHITTGFTTFSDASEPDKNLDDELVQNDGGYFVSPNRHGSFTRIQSSLNILFYTTVSVVGLVLISSILIFATRKQRFKLRRKKGLETV